MTREEWVNKAVSLAEAMAELYGNADDIYNHGFGDVEAQAQAARSEYASAKSELVKHLLTQQSV
jgi:hypothetical protein